MENNFAFIDGNNVHLGIEALGWKLDWKRFRVQGSRRATWTLSSCSRR